MFMYICVWNHVDALAREAKIGQCLQAGHGGLSVLGGGRAASSVPGVRASPTHCGDVALPLHL